jgi:hypothetical protein
MSARGIPLKFDRAAEGRAFAQSVLRACTASLIAANRKGQSCADLAAKLWPSDRDVGLVLRAASAPADTTTSTWAAPLTNIGAVVDLISLLSPASAAAALLSRCISIPWPEGVSGISMPALAPDPAAAAWTAQGDPLQVIDLVVAANNPIVLVASPRQAAAIAVRADINFPTLASSAMPDKSLAAIATNALFSVGDSAPRFDTSLASSLHMDSSPGQLGIPGTPNTISAPARSVWQTDCIALKMQFSINWALRSSAGVAWINNTAAW